MMSAGDDSARSAYAMKAMRLSVCVSGLPVVSGAPTSSDMPGRDEG
ncbi:hypothetical protein BN1232_01392 [Mycobacterium lentiflavum]|uniref:Uncharacterized protein n=1 Tax=Mycobacterium lentiflavum TaxID=141349 RepID=A0A0E4CM22_MYCLN|nr:hypothetical protein BN1232_01392 [Mycobacterium lentiflavum]